MAASNLGIRRLHSVEICVHAAEPWIDYFTKGCGFQPVAISSDEAIEQTGTRRRLLRCGQVCLVLQEPVHGGSTVKNYLDRHPEGISRVNFVVADVRQTEQRLLERHATPTGFIETAQAGSGQWRQLGIATPLGDVEFCFVECSGDADEIMAGMEPCGAYDAGHNPAGLCGIDHLTAHTRTLMPVIAFYEHVLGFARLWDVHFHTEEIKPGVGSGLKSVVMWDKESGVKLATSEPLRPRYDQSQVQLYIETNRGPGIGQMAFGVDDLFRAVDHCRLGGILFLPTRKAYYRSLPDRIRSLNIARLGHSLEEIEKREILLDGDKDGYLLQVFCQDQAVQFKRPAAGPLSIELIERCGCQGFGEGNFRALFEAEARENSNG